ncbi:creatininase [Longimycelium tulufanense]|uniref:Creatininase n=1 Tax=Longimycelium tulufanense TaxID=907463 RepID=A0A8J3CGG5_9PSEU|nr:creatininase family protein [Longimycelium tulufanense]GGM63479.1 creatininase [Longimycelium tulufanense]
MRRRTTTVRRYGDLTSAQVGSTVEGSTLVWAVGGLEQHGPHLPLSVDHDIPSAIAEEVAAALDGYLLPSQPISARSLPQSGGGLHLPGTVHLRGTTLVEYLTDCLRGLSELRPGRLVIINGHYENEGLLFEAIDGCRPTDLFRDTVILAASWWSFVHGSFLARELPDFPGWHAEHAGLTETSLMLYLRPDTVRASRPGHDTPPLAGVYVHPLDVSRMSNQGVLSSTEGASADLGERLFWHVVDNVCELVRSGYGVPREGLVTADRAEGRP